MRGGGDDDGDVDKPEEEDDKPEEDDTPEEEDDTPDKDDEGGDDEPDDDEEDECEDDAEFKFRKNKKLRDCDWIRKKPKKRCKDKFESKEGVSAVDACAKTCGECEDPDECRDDEDYYHGRDEEHDCVWVAFAARSSEDGVAARPRPRRGYSVESRWRTQVEEKPRWRCKKKGAKKACCICSEI